MKIFNLDEFINVHRSVESKIDKARLTPGGRRKISNQVANEMRAYNATGFPSNNVNARIALASAISSNVRILAKTHPAANYAMVTLIDNSHVCSIEEARRFETKKLTEWAAGFLRGENMVGFVDVGLYIQNYGKRPQPDLVSWHVHCLVWDFDTAKMDRRMEKWNDWARTLIPGVTPAHIKNLPPKSAANNIFYMAKGPVQQYQRFKKLDRNTGERKPWQKGTEVRPGNALLVMKVMAKRTLHETTFALGEGKEMLKQAFITAKGELAAANAISARNRSDTIRSLNC